MENMFNDILQTKVDKDKENLEAEKALKKKFGIDENKTVGIKIEKENILSAFFKIISKIISKLAFLIILTLAFIGLVSILHPDARQVMIKIFMTTVIEFGFQIR
jgi:hypothetical protein